MNYIVEKQPQTFEKDGTSVYGTDVYSIRSTKEATTPDGKKIEVLSDDVEMVSVHQLETQKASYQDAIAEIDIKLAEIEKLK